MFKSKRVMFFTLVIMLLAFSCSGPESDQTLLTADVPLHLEEHLDAARIEGSQVPEDIPAPVEWRFDKPQPDWKPAHPRNPSAQKVKVSRTDDALRMMLREPDPHSNWIARALDGIYIDLADWNREDWAYVDVRARASGGVALLGIGFNLPEGDLKAKITRWALPDLFFFPGEQADVFNDGSVQTYRMRADWSWRSGFWKGPWKQLGILAQARRVSTNKPAGIDILSVSVIPKAANYVAGPIGVRTEVRKQAYRHTLYTHAPGRVEYRVRIPQGGRLDVGLGVLRDDALLTFRVTAEQENGLAENLFEEIYADKERWAQRSIDLSHLGGKTVTLVLEADAKRAGSVALWAAPTLSGASRNDKPNIIFYVIDGGAAEQMSIYGYNRRTTPYLERLAAEGAVFEHAYSNSSFTRPSTASFMTSLQHSVFGGLKNNRNVPPDQVLTMAEHLHRAGYQTAVLTVNPNAGTMSNLDRGVDVLREAGAGSDAESSRELHDDFWRWRARYPGEPYWVHFQTTDVHEYADQPGVPPFFGLFISPERRQIYNEWKSRLSKAGGYELHSSAFEKTGISRVSFFEIQRGLYDEAMAHQDYQIGQLVERLKAIGEWESTLLIVAADHSFLAAGEDDFVLGMLDPLPPRWGPMFRPSVTRIPMIFVWPGHIAPRQRFLDPVSMIDMLPTILDLADLPMPEVIQGQSLAPLLLGKQGWEPRPVILDEFRVDRDTGELSGLIEVVDGRWGASLEVHPDRDDAVWWGQRDRPVPLLLWDLWNDPYCLKSLHEERPDLVKKYTEFLEVQFEAHQALAELFTRSEDSPLTPEQLRTLRSLGYIK